jgi:hypothetical protein
MTSAFCSSGYYLVHEHKHRIFLACLHERGHKGKHLGEHTSKNLVTPTPATENVRLMAIRENQIYEWTTPQAEAAPVPSVYLNDSWS